MYRRATATAWILLADLGTVLLTVSLSFSDRTEGMVGKLKATDNESIHWPWKGGLVGDTARVVKALILRIGDK